MVEVSAGASVLEPPQAARDSVMAAARTSASSFFFIILFSFDFTFGWVDRFNHKNKGALSAEQNTLAFNG